MIDDIPIRQLNIDSRARVGTAGTASSFQIELLEPVQLPTGCAAWVTEVQCPIAWRNIEPGVNNKVYYSETYNGTTRYNIVELDGEEYTLWSLDVALQGKLNAAISSGPLPPAVSYGHNAMSNSFELPLLYNDHEYRWDLAPVEQNDMWTLNTGAVFAVVRDYTYDAGSSSYMWHMSPVYELDQVSWTVYGGLTPASVVVVNITFGATRISIRTA